MNRYGHCMSTAVDTDMQTSSSYMHENLPIILCHSYVHFTHYFSVLQSPTICSHYCHTTHVLISL